MTLPHNHPAQITLHRLQQLIGKAAFGSSSDQHSALTCAEQLLQYVPLGVPAESSPSKAAKAVGTPPSANIPNNVPVLTEQDATLLNQAIELLEDLSGQERRRGNDSTAKGATCSANAVQRLGSALLAEISAPAAQAVEPTDAELIALNAGECYFGESPSKYPELGHGTQYRAGAPGVLGFARAALALRSDPAAYSQKFQQRVQPWMMTCFGPEISADRIERNHRFLEESLELVQSLGCTASEAHQLVDYVYGRPAGEPAQEAGGVMVTLAALCLASGLDMHACGETELARIWTKVEAIRAKQAAKPKHSPLPMHAPQAQADARDADTFEQRMSDWQHADALDAERYRWLRSRDLETISQGGVFAGMTPQNVILNEEDLDEAVDAAIAAQTSQQTMIVQS